MRPVALAAFFFIAASGAVQAQAPRPAQTPVPAAPGPSTTRPQVTVQPTQPEQRPPQLSKTEVSYFDNWQTTCQEFINPARRQCSALLQLVQTNQQTNQGTVLINWVLTSADAQLNSTIQTPSGVSIAPGIELKVGRTSKKVPFARCDGQRCEGTLVMDDALSRELATVEAVELLITGSQGNVVTFSIPVKGYDRAAQALRR